MCEIFEDFDLAVVRTLSITGIDQFLFLESIPIFKFPVMVKIGRETFGNLFTKSRRTLDISGTGHETDGHSPWNTRRPNLHRATEIFQRKCHQVNRGDALHFNTSIQKGKHGYQWLCYLHVMVTAVTRAARTGRLKQFLVPSGTISRYNVPTVQQRRSLLAPAFQPAICLSTTYFLSPFWRCSCNLLKLSRQHVLSPVQTQMSLVKPF
jgi:hypothetical protein